MFCVSVVLVAVGSICTLDKAGRILTPSLQCLITKCMDPSEGRPRRSSGHARAARREWPPREPPRSRTAREPRGAGEGGRGRGEAPSRKMTSPFSLEQVEKGRKCLGERQPNPVSRSGS